VRCLRKRHYLRDDVLGAAVEWFNALCVDDFDLPAFRQWQAAQADLEAAGEEAAGGAAGDVAARAAEAAKQQQQATAGKGDSGDGEEVEDFWALQDEFYKEPAGKAAAGQQQEQQEAPAATER